MALVCACLQPSAAAVPLSDAVDVACAMEMFHEASLVHDDICDGSLLRRDAPSVPAAFGVRTAARAGFHLAGKALQVLARVLADNPAVFARLGEVPGVTYLDRISELSAGQLVESLPPAVDDAAALRRHYELVAGAKTGTLFRLACSYGGTAGGLHHHGLSALMRYADHLALAFQIMDDVRDVEGGPAVGSFALLARVGPCVSRRRARAAVAHMTITTTAFLCTAVGAPAPYRRRLRLAAAVLAARSQVGWATMLERVRRSADGAIHQVLRASPKPVAEVSPTRSSPVAEVLGLGDLRSM
ncbi:polyprenyl synthetase family protein [Mycobacterium sp. DL99]|uniref:polyprenyl synthetase family protein n=1 Tax=Mycobacterium sp. DL99 TaxID=2528957 RepID=UPI0025703C3E|nr:polyprenyl synthetase family protein [Mycobacterium sp. DL99]